MTTIAIGSEIIFDGEWYKVRKHHEPLPRIPAGYYRYDWDEDHRIAQFQAQPLSADAIALNPSQVASLAHIRQFWDAAPIYAELGVAHKRGVLLYGRPGTGKSTLIRAVVRDLVERGGLALSFGSPHEFSLCLGALRAVQTDAPVALVMEDMESWCTNSMYEQAMLNIMDGLSGIEHMLFLGTTNMIEKVPERMKARPSRFDVVMEIGYPDAIARETYFAGIANLPSDVRTKLVALTDGLSIAHCKEVLLREAVFGGITNDVLNVLRAQCGAQAPAAETDEDDDDEAEHAKAIAAADPLLLFATATLRG